RLGFLASSGPAQLDAILDTPLTRAVMTTRHSHSTLAAPRGPGPRSYHAAPRPDHVAAVPSPLLEAAARRVVAAWESEYGEVSDGIVEALAALALTVHRQQAGVPGPIDAAARSTLGERLLELLRAEVVEGWSSNRTAHAEVLATLTAIERVRAAIEPDWLRDFTSRLAGPNGLEILVDVAHDLRSPLTSILFLAETLQRGQS